MDVGARLDGLRFLLRDRDTKYTAAFDDVFKTEEVEVIVTPPQAPKANAICERVIGTLRRELLDHVLVYNEAHALALLAEYRDHYNEHRPHQARQHLPPGSMTKPAASDDRDAPHVGRRPILAGLIGEYQHAA